MAILNLVKEQEERNTAPRRGVAAQDRPAAKLWLNIGYMKNEKFINLPIGLPIDTMEPVRVSGQEDWAKFQSARNGLLKAIQDAGANLQPGAACELNLTIQLRHVNDAIDVKAEDNEYALEFGVVTTVAEAEEPATK